MEKGLVIFNEYYFLIRHFKILTKNIDDSKTEVRGLSRKGKLYDLNNAIRADLYLKNRKYDGELPENRC